MQLTTQLFQWRSRNLRVCNSLLSFHVIRTEHLIFITDISCGSSEVINLNEESKLTITSPGFPYGYAPNVKCEWIFSTVPMNHIEVLFKSINFGVINILLANRCQYFDYVRISQKQVISNEWTVLQDICKFDQVEDGIVGTNLVKVEFVANNYLNGTGFKATVYDSKYK